MHFNSHAHVERDCVKILQWQNNIKFQLTRSRGAWPEGLFSDWWTGYFNSHAHVERDFIRVMDKYKAKISTHTLTWSVTFCKAPYFVSQKISTHTLTWSVTLLQHLYKKRQRFQLTRSRGAWRKWTSLFRKCRNFNSHAHVERDKKKIHTTLRK